MLPPFQVSKSTFNQPVKLTFEWYYPACYLLNYTYVKISKWTILIKIKMKIGWSGKKAYYENSSEYSLLSDIRLIGEPVIAKRYCYVLHHFPLYFFLLIIKIKPLSDYRNRIKVLISNQINKKIIRHDIIVNKHLDISINFLDW